MVEQQCLPLTFIVTDLHNKITSGHLYDIAIHSMFECALLTLNGAG